jgi:ribonuclease Z
MAGLWHTQLAATTTPLTFAELRKVYDGPVVQLQDLTVFNVTKEAVVARQAQVEPSRYPFPGSRASSPRRVPRPSPTGGAEALIPLDDVLALA